MNNHLCKKISFFGQKQFHINLNKKETFEQKKENCTKSHLNKKSFNKSNMWKKPFYKESKNTSLAALGALSHRLEQHTTNLTIMVKS